MVVVEVLSGFHAHSVSLMADALDFFGDVMNYSISLAVLSMSLMWRARAALLKGLTMGAFGLFVLASAAWSFTHGKVPEPYTMGIIGILALVASVGIAISFMRIVRETPICTCVLWASKYLRIDIFKSADHLQKSFRTKVTSPQNENLGAITSESTGKFWVDIKTYTWRAT